MRGGAIYVLVAVVHSTANPRGYPETSDQNLKCLSIQVRFPGWHGLPSTWLMRLTRRTPHNPFLSVVRMGLRRDRFVLA
jgi:hypothetical protein